MYPCFVTTCISFAFIFNIILDNFIQFLSQGKRDSYAPMPKEEKVECYSYVDLEVENLGPPMSNDDDINQYVLLSIFKNSKVCVFVHNVNDKNIVSLRNMGFLQKKNVKKMFEYMLS